MTNSGTYTILVHSAGYNDTAGYSLEIQSYTNGGCSGNEIVAGKTVGATTGQNAEIVSYGYSGNAELVQSFFGAKSVLYAKD